MKPYKLRPGSKFWVKSKNGLVPVSKEEFTKALRKYAELKKK